MDNIIDVMNNIQAPRSVYLIREREGKDYHYCENTMDDYYQIFYYDQYDRVHIFGSKKEMVTRIQEDKYKHDTPSAAKYGITNTILLNANT
jgi:hypothetical protein